MESGIWAPRNPGQPVTYVLNWTTGSDQSMVRAGLLSTAPAWREREFCRELGMPTTAGSAMLDTRSMPGRAGDQVLH
jgi:hypothetical protein